MRKHITVLFLFLFGIIYSQNTTLTTTQKEELINYDYYSYFAQEKTVGDFLSEIPYVNTTNNQDYLFTRGQNVYLTGLRILFNCENKAFHIILHVEKFNHVISQEYNANNPWDLDNLKLEKIDYIEIYDATSNEFKSIVKTIELN